VNKYEFVKVMRLKSYDVPSRHSNFCTRESLGSRGTSMTPHLPFDHTMPIAPMRNGSIRRGSQIETAGSAAGVICFAKYDGNHHHG